MFNENGFIVRFYSLNTKVLLLSSQPQSVLCGKIFIIPYAWKLPLVLYGEKTMESKWTKASSIRKFSPNRARSHIRILRNSLVNAEKLYMWDQFKLKCEGICEKDALAHCIHDFPSQKEGISISFAQNNAMVIDGFSKHHYNSITQLSTRHFVILRIV